MLLALPITVITLGLFLLVLNGAMLGLAELVVPGFVIVGFWTALFGAIIVSLTGGWAVVVQTCLGTSSRAGCGD